MKTIWLLAITLSSNPTQVSYYEFESFADCMNAVAPVEVLYESLGDPADVSCIPGVPEKPQSELFPSFEKMKEFKVQGVSFTF